MIYINCIILIYLLILIWAQLPSSSTSLLPVYNPTTRCHHLVLFDQNLTFALCFQRTPEKPHPHNHNSAPKFCSTNYPPDGHSVDLFSLSSSTIDKLFQSLTNLYNVKNSYIDPPKPNYLWIGSNFTQTLTNNEFWCPEQCREKTESQKFLIINMNCSYNNASKPCVSTKSLDWPRAPFVCLTNQVINIENQISLEPIQVTPIYSNDTIVFYDKNSCLIARTSTHQYTFCFRRQSCPHAKNSAFCTARHEANRICKHEKNGSNLLTIENDDEYQLVSDIISRYSNETILNEDGILTNKRNSPAQWMWIDGMKSSNNTYQWYTDDNIEATITDKYWCDKIMNCSGGRGNDYVALSISCQANSNSLQVCLASKRRSEPAPFVCKRTLRKNEEIILNYSLLRSSTPATIESTTVTPVYEKNLTSIYYDEQHCLTVQTRSYLYTFCLRRQNCTETKAYCTKWSQAQNDCKILKNQANLLTIENDQERLLVTDIIQNYSHETRLAFNGSSYRFYHSSHFVWIDGVLQADSQRYLWNNGREPIPEHLWCPKNECDSTPRDRVMLNLMCHKKNSLVCLGTRREWYPAPYICKRVRTKDQCPFSFDKLLSISSSEMIIIAVNRTLISIKCRHPKYSTDIKLQYQCDIQTNQWELIYKNDKFTCPVYDIPPMMISSNKSQTTGVTTSTQTIYYVLSTLSAIEENDCSQSELTSIINNLPTQNSNIYSQTLKSYSSSYYDTRLTCYSNDSIQITYRCDLSRKQWIYVYGITNSFEKCYSPCTDDERNALLNKYFAANEQSKISVKYIQRNKSLLLSCLNIIENRWKSIRYRCGTMAITTAQWFKLHSCFQSTAVNATQPTVVVSMLVNQIVSSCPPVVARSSRCEQQLGAYIIDANGCKRKVCPPLSNLCNTIRCPPDHICRVIPCQECILTDYLQPVCKHLSQTSLCELQRQLTILDDPESIRRWERDAIAAVQRYAVHVVYFFFYSDHQSNDQLSNSSILIEKALQRIPTCTPDDGARQSALLHTLLQWSQFAQEHNIRYWIAYKTLLGYAQRDGLLPNALDVDILAMAQDTSRLAELRTLNFSSDYELKVHPQWFIVEKTRRSYFDEEGIDFVGPNARFVNRKDHVHINIWPMYDYHPNQTRIEKNSKPMLTECDRNYKWKSSPKEWTFPLQKYLLSGIKVWCPTDSKNLVAHIYGKVSGNLSSIACVNGVWI
ncbi:unnamed protein product [Rotaria magnacalcarata]|uniref:C-type lectin domain-containing protein n=1 Tax=Rotaria magnacalcarata TaxID=392030 RepID=A0A816QJ69_9BILA|nr:unnamed protein product [Rotaria magnacalcarata]